MLSKVKNSCIAKSCKTKQRNSLLAAILLNPTIIPSCSFYKGRGISSCQVSPYNSSRYAEYVCLNRSCYDVLGPSSAKLRNITAQHKKLEDELKAAEDCILRLRKQKRIQYDKIICTVSYRLDTIKELDRVKAEEHTEKEHEAVKAKAACSAITAMVDPVKGINQSTVNLGSLIDIGFVIKGNSLLSSTPGSSS